MEEVPSHALAAGRSAYSLAQAIPVEVPVDQAAETEAMVSMGAALVAAVTAVMAVWQVALAVMVARPVAHDTALELRMLPNCARQSNLC